MFQPWITRIDPNRGHLEVTLRAGTSHQRFISSRLYLSLTRDVVPSWDTGIMIDWPNAVTGFGSGVLTTLMFWIPGRIRAKRERRRDIWEEWKVAMRDLEFVAWKPDG
jgi:hypothetical protein